MNKSSTSLQIHVCCYIASTLSYYTITEGRTIHPFIDSFAFLKKHLLNSTIVRCFTEYWNSGSKFYLHVKVYWGT